MNNIEMGCLKSDENDEIHPDVSLRKRFKFPKKFFDECNGVDHASVPRRVRSVIKKRTRKPISPPLPISKKANRMSDGAETQRKYVNKSKINLAHCGPSRSIKEELDGPITKDEEEVAETLYALAGMIPDTGTLSESKINSQLPEVKSLDLPEPETSMIARGVVTAEQDIRTTSSQFSAEALKQFPDVVVSAGEAVKSKSFDEASRCDTSINTEQLEISRQPVVAYQANQHNTHKEKRKNGSLLWPGLSAVGSSCSGTLDSSPQSPIAKFPVWIGSTGSDLQQAQNAKSCLPTVKDSQVPLDLRKSFKRCAAHVYISRLTKVLQTAVKGDTVSSHPSESSSPDGVKQEPCLIQNSPTGKVNDMHGIVSTGSIASTAEKNPTEVRNAILLHKRLLQDQQQASATSGFNSSVKQNADFLSLSAGSYVMKGTNGATIAGPNLEMPVTSQKHPTLHFLLPQNGYSSAPFRYHPATAATQQMQVLLPPYLGGASICPSREATIALPRQMSQQNELQNAQFAAQYKFGGVSTSQMRDWQNAGRQMPIFGPAQAQFAGSSSSMEALPSKYVPPLLNEQELMSISTSRATSRIRGQYYSFPSGLEGSGHGLYPNNVPSMQLLCNDRR